ncbi:unnamed protein product, partial [Mesorhabditis spiculigera]
MNALESTLIASTRRPAIARYVVYCILHPVKNFLYSIGESILRFVAILILELAHDLAMSIGNIFIDVTESAIRLMNGISYILLAVLEDDLQNYREFIRDEQAETDEDEPLGDGDINYSTLSYTRCEGEECDWPWHYITETGGLTECYGQNVDDIFYYQSIWSVPGGLPAASIGTTGSAMNVPPGTVFNNSDDSMCTRLTLEGPEIESFMIHGQTGAAIAIAYLGVECPKARDKNLYVPGICNQRCPQNCRLCHTSKVRSSLATT